jgi:adenosylhomocysteine nucleosidase
VVLISADAEWRAVRARLPGAVARQSPFGEWFPVVLPDDGQGEQVLFFHGGWGKIAAAASTQYVIDRWSPALLINLGTCGGFEGEVDRGTIILAERTLVYDIVEQMGDPAEHIAHYATELDLDWLGDGAPGSVRRALLVSADRDLLADDVSMLRERYHAIAGDWESGAIAWVAARNGIRCLILRGVTDLVGSDGGEAYGNLALFEQETGAVIGSLLDSLPAWIAQAKGRIYS